MTELRPWGQTAYGEVIYLDCDGNKFVSLESHNSALRKLECIGDETDKLRQRVVEALNGFELPSICRVIANQIPDMVISELKLSPGLENALLRGGLTTVEQLLNCNPRDFHKVRSLGEVRYEELMAKLEPLRQRR